MPTDTETAPEAPVVEPVTETPPVVVDPEPETVDAPPVTASAEPEPIPGRESIALVAAAAPGDPVFDDAGGLLPARWSAIACIEGVPTGDGRFFELGCFGTRPLPLSLTYKPVTSPGHDGATVCGLVDSLERDTTTGAIMATGSFDLGGEAGREAARQCRDEVLRFVSADLAECSAQEVLADFETNDLGDTQPTSSYLSFSKANIAALSMLAVPAYYQCVIVPEDSALNLSTLADTLEPLQLITAAAFGDLFPTPEMPPADWFTDPAFDAPQDHVTITADGRLFGHAALWGTPHIGYASDTVLAPKSRSGYAFFHRGVTLANDTDGNEVQVRTGPLTMGVGHASERLGFDAAKSHYDDVRSAVADISVGEDEHGIWFAGAIRPGVTNGQVRALRASGVSGDWREPRKGYGLEFMALLAVNVPGFPTALAASAHHVESDPRPKVFIDEGRTLALVAAGRPRHNSSSLVVSLSKRVAELEHLTASMRTEKATSALSRLRNGVS